MYMFMNGFGVNVFGNMRQRQNLREYVKPKDVMMLNVLVFHES